MTLFWLQVFNLPALLQNKNSIERSVLQNPDRERTNQGTGICLRLALPYTGGIEFIISRRIHGIICLYWKAIDIFGYLHLLNAFQIGRNYSSCKPIIRQRFLYPWKKICNVFLKLTVTFFIGTVSGFRLHTITISSRTIISVMRRTEPLAGMFALTIAWTKA